MPTINLFVNLAVLAVTLLVIVVIALVSRKHIKKQSEIRRLFLEEEEHANNVRKRDLDPELYFVPDLSHLPALPQGDPFKIERCAKRTIVRLDPPMSNLELKKLYGPAQMELIAQYEENYVEFLRCLNEWGISLTSEGRNADALKVLEYAISLGTEFRTTYKQAADIYAAAENYSALEALYEQASETLFRDPAVQKHVLSYVDQKLGEFEA